MAAILEVENVVKSYGPIHALNKVSLTMGPGQITGVIGPNGCGKTTIIKSILGLIIPDSGKISINGVNIRGDHEYRREIGYLPQNPDFPSHLSIRELLDLLEDLRGQKAPLREELCHLFELDTALNRSFATLSGGTKQKIAAVTAFMFRPKILILDEPTVGLDPVSAANFKKWTRQTANEGAGILIVSHIISEMEKLLDNMVFLVDGQVHFSGSISELRNISIVNPTDKAIAGKTTGTGTSSNDLETAVVNLMSRKMSHKKYV